MICLRTFDNAVEAQLVAGLLEAAGIPAHVAADDVGGAHPQMQPTWGVRVYVPDSSREAAERVLAEEVVLDDEDAWAEGGESPPDESS